MTVGRFTAIVAAVAVALSVSPSPARAGIATDTTSAGTWGDSVEAEGFADLSSGGSGGASMVSCPVAGYCTVAGAYRDSNGDIQPLVLSESAGTWGTTQAIPGTASLGPGSGILADLSCPAAGDCAVSGTYQQESGARLAFVDDESDGTWGTAQEIPGLAALDVGSGEWMQGLSCPSPGNCAADGYYTDSAGDQQGFIAEETDGTWGTASPVPGLSGLNAGGSAAIGSVWSPCPATAVPAGTTPMARVTCRRS